MDQITNFIIVLAILIVLMVIVLVSLMKRAKNDPDSFRHRFADEYDFFEVVDHYSSSEVVSRNARPAYPDINDPKYMLAWAKEKEAEERLKMARLEDLELWEEGRR